MARSNVVLLFLTTESSIGEAESTKEIKIRIAFKSSNLFFLDNYIEMTGLGTNYYVLEYISSTNTFFDSPDRTRDDFDGTVQVTLKCAL